MKNFFSRGFHFFITGLPLLIYPFVFVASIMGLAGNPDGAGFLNLIVALSFLWLSLLYPVAFIVCVIGFFKSKKYKTHFVLSSYGYIILCVLLFFLWLAIGS